MSAHFNIAGTAGRPALPAPMGDRPLLPPHVDPQGGGGHRQGHHQRGGRLLVWIGIGLVIVSLLVVLTLVLVHRHRVAKVRGDRSGELAKGPKLTVVKVGLSRPEREISLPGEVRGFNQATLYAKTSGYVAEMRVDRGDRVKAGDILAVIESPEVKDDVLSAESNREITKRTAQRLDSLSGMGVVSMIDRDNAVNAARRADADLKRARTLADYTLVRAPFDGVVTSRYVDLGALVPAATSTTQQAQPVVDVAQIDMVRVFVYVGQDAAQFVKAGDQVAIYEDERPSQRVPATVTRVSGALDPRTRTMQCEVDVDNRKWHLIPGTFVHVRLTVDIPSTPVVPNETLVTRDGTPHVAIVDQNKVHYRAVEVGNNDGKTTRIESGLVGGELVGMNVPVQVDDDQLVQPVEAKSKGAGGGSESATSAAGSPTTTPTSVARPPPPGPDGAKAEAMPEPNIAQDNGVDAGGAKPVKNAGSGSGGSH